MSYNSCNNRRSSPWTPDMRRAVSGSPTACEFPEECSPDVRDLEGVEDGVDETIEVGGGCNVGDDGSCLLVSYMVHIPSKDNHEIHTWNIL